MKNFFLVIILNSAFLILHSISFAQHNKIDSLLTLIKKDKQDTNKVNHLNALGWELMYQNPDTAIVLGNLALDIITPVLSPEFIHPEEVIDDKGIRFLRANTFSNLGVYYYLKADYHRALDYHLKALKIDEDLKNKKGIATRLGNIGIVYKDQGNYPQALDYNFKALSMDEDLDNKKGVSRHLGNIGNVYRIQGDYSKALDYLLKALKMAKELGDKNGIARCLCNIGNVYVAQGDYPQAQEYYFKALKMVEKLGKIGHQAILDNIGSSYTSQKKYPKALDYYFMALKMSEELGNKNGIARTLGNIGSLYTKTGKFKDAEQYLKRAIAIDDSIGALHNLRDAEEFISQLYDTTGRHKLALIHYKKAIALKDTLFSQENKKQLVRKEMNYEFDKKEAATKAESDKQQAVAEAEKKKQQFILILVSCVLILVFLFAGYIFRSLRITRKQKKIIESQNFQIVESINYSQKIQNALLPEISDMQKSIANLFVFYEPKDIVSGDFYYFCEFEKYTLLACVDCTGHGVPGGFMSTVGSLLLDKIVNTEILSPSEILKKLSDEIIRVLHQQDGGEIQDGMDLSICLIDRDNKKIEFSGARNGIIIVADGQAKRYKADLLPVGGNYLKKGVQIDRKFQTQSIIIKPNDWIYMYTDGFMEQVGEKENVPMNYLQFENQLISVSKKQTPEEKNKFLQTEIDNWRGKHERDDDVLIMGFQII